VEYEKAYVGAQMQGGFATAQTTASPAQRDGSTVGGGLLMRLEELNQTLSELMQRQRAFVLRVLPPEPRPEGVCGDKRATINGNLTNDLQCILALLTDNISELAYWTERMGKIA
jgi:hypothetical protein